MNCDHGMSLDRYCAPCEKDLYDSVIAEGRELLKAYPELEPESREWSRRTVLVCIALAVLLVELAAWFGRNQS